jgi:Flp pilus assembly protein CpaB
VAQLQTADVLVAKADIGLGHTVTPEDMQWQTWPALTASDTFIRRSDRPDATTQTGTLSLALRSIGDINMVENRTDDEVPSRGETLNVVRYGIPSATTTQK